MQTPLPTDTVDARTAGQMCSICQTALIAGETMIRCPDCDLAFHKECWQENRGCGQYGCRSAPETVKTDAVTDFQTQIWGTEKPCPSCGQMIKAKAQKCRFCGAVFEDRGFISKDAYAGREYTGQEYETVRNKIFLFFFAGATGFLTPVALILLLLLRFSGSLWNISYRRLPFSLQAMVLIGLGIDSLLFVVFLLLILFD